MRLLPLALPLSMAVAGCDGFSSPSPQGALAGHIVFTLWDADAGDLGTFSVRANITELRLLRAPADSSDPLNLVVPKVSPTGDYVAFLSNSGTDSNFYLVAAHSGEVSAIALPFAPASLAWAPGGRRLAMRCYDPPAPGIPSTICTVNVDGSNPKRLDHLPFSAADPSWSPHGQHLVFSAFADTSTELFTMRPDGRDVRQLTHHGGVAQTPFWSPDGGHIAYVAWLGVSGERDYLTVINADGSDPRQLTPAAPCLAWAPNSRAIIFCSPRGTIASIDVTGAREHDLLGGGRRFASFPSWAP
jgi:Tol biopolymer transport system component